MRTLSPQYVICDEIASAEDAGAILYAHAAGVRVVASAHGGSIEEVRKNAAICDLIDRGVFGYIFGLEEKV